MLTPEEVAKYCPEDWERYQDCKYGDIPCYCGYIEHKAQARKERDVLKQALERYAIYFDPPFRLGPDIAKEALASINKDS